MLYLIFSILFMAGLAVCLAGGAQRGADALGLNAMFRLVGGALGVVALLMTQNVADAPRLWSEVGWLALVAGGLYWLSGYAAIQAVGRGHVGATWTATRCSVVLPALASIVYWGEIPLWPFGRLLAMRLGGLGLTVAAAVLMGLDRARPHPGDRSKPVCRTWLAWLAVAFLAQGSWEITLRASGALDSEAARGFFIAVVFVTAMVLALAAWGARRPRLGRREIVYGLLAGICGFIGSGLRPWALRDLDGIVVFPITAISVMLLVQAAATLLWRHHLSRWGLAGLAVAVAAIVSLTV